MNKIVVNGILKRDGKEYAAGHAYRLDVARKSGTVDSLLVLHPDNTLPEGPVAITGKLKSEYIHGLGVPAYIAPDTVTAVTENEAAGVSEASVTGTLKAVPKCRKCRNTHNAKVIASILLKTEDGTIPVILWGNSAKKAEDKFRAGDTVTVTGRMQSREYSDKKGGRHTTYELSSYRVELGE